MPVDIDCRAVMNVSHYSGAKSDPVLVQRTQDDMYLAENPSLIYDSTADS